MSEKNDTLSWGQKIGLNILWWICCGFAWLPRVVRHYVFGSFIYFILCYATRYRRKVIMTNLRNSFPEKSEKELNRICKDSYKNLAEQIINTISQAGISDKALMRRTIFVNADEVRKEVNGGHVICITAHYGSWEGASTVSLYMPKQRMVAVYHKLQNKLFDELMKRIRQHTNVDLVTMQRTMRHFVENRNKQPMLLGLISDQNPAYRPNLHWHKFLHQWSAFFDGAEVMALKYNIPVYYYSPRRVKAGVYEGRLIRIYDGKEEVAEHEIMERYVRALEKDIIANPPMWMWSHRRWKHIPPKELQEIKF